MRPNGSGATELPGPADRAAPVRRRATVQARGEELKRSLLELDREATLAVDTRQDLDVSGDHHTVARGVGAPHTDEQRLLGRARRGS